MTSPLNRVSLSQLSSVEREAVEAFSASLVDRFGGKVTSISLHGTRSQLFQQSRELNLLILLRKEDADLEAGIEELALDQLVDTGVYLTLRCFDRAQFETFKEMELPMILSLEADKLQLWAA